MKYNINDILFCRLDSKRQKGRKVLDVVPRYGAYEMPFYKFEENKTKNGIVWSPEWMLYTEDEFVAEVKSGQLLDIQLGHYLQFLIM
jgi:hypothetical protein